jgi:hypothetical protein
MGSDASSAAITEDDSYFDENTFTLQWKYPTSVESEEVYVPICFNKGQVIAIYPTLKKSSNGRSTKSVPNHFTIFTTHGQFDCKTCLDFDTLMDYIWNGLDDDYDSEDMSEEEEGSDAEEGSSSESSSEEER